MLFLIQLQFSGEFSLETKREEKKRASTRERAQKPFSGKRSVRQRNN